MTARLLAILLFLCGAASAQSVVPVVGIELPDRSRLELAMPGNVDWDLQTESNKARLWFSDPSLQFLTEAVFETLPRTRVLAVADLSGEGRSGIEVTLGCRCEVLVSRAGADRIVLEVRRSARQKMSSDQTGTRNSFLHPLAVTAALNETGDAAAPSAQAANAPDHSEPHDAVLETQEALTEEADIPNQTREPVDAQRKLLVEELLHIAGEGLLNLVEEPGDPAPLPADPIHSSEPPTVSAAAGGGSSEQIRLHSAFDRPVSVGTQVPNPDNCAIETRLDAANWASGAPFGEAIGLLRLAAITELDTQDSGAVEKLAQFYISQGFGLEAASVLNGFSVALPARALLFDMAAVVEGIPPAANGPLARMGDCGGRASLWSAAAGFGPDRFGNHLPDGFAEALSELQPPLRRLLGEQLAAHLLEADATESLKQLLLILERAPGEKTPEEHLLGAKLQHISGSSDQAYVAVLAPLAMQQTPTALAAIIERTRLQLDNGLSPEPGLLADLASEMRVRRGSGPGLEATLVLARALAAGNDIVGAVDLLLDERKNYDPAEQGFGKVASEILKAAQPSQGGEANFVRAAIAAGDLIAHNRDGSLARDHLFREMMTLGVPNLSLNPSQANPLVQTPEALLVLAEALVLQGRGLDALATLQNLQSPEAQKMRVRAYRAEQDYASAYLAMQNLEGAEAEKDSLALLSGNWRDVNAENTTPTTRKILALTLAGETPAETGTHSGVSGTNGPFRAGSDLLDSGTSANTEKTLSLQILENTLTDSRDIRGAFDEVLQSDAGS